MTQTLNWKDLLVNAGADTILVMHISERISPNLRFDIKQTKQYGVPWNFRFLFVIQEISQL